MTKLWGGAKSESERERKLEKLLKKLLLKKSRSIFKKKKKLIHNVRLIEKQFRSIKPDRGSQKILKKISIDWRTDWINQKFGKTSV